jgi:RNA polymerase sigma-70 factor (ECF subfamily)
MDEQENTPEAELLERIRSSDQKAFQLLFEKYQPLLFRSILYNVEDADSAHDIVQETFVRVWNHRSSIRPHLSFLAYLFRISRNLVKDRARHAAVRKKFEPRVPEAVQPQKHDPEESARSALLVEQIAHVVRTKLPKKCKEVFLLSRMEGMSHAEIAEKLGISPKTVENQITRALRILRRWLRE